MKTCTKCGVEKTPDEFRKERGCCKACIASYKRQWKKDHPEKVKADKRKWYVRHKDRELARIIAEDKAHPGRAAARHRAYVERASHNYVKRRTGLPDDKIEAYRETLLVAREAREFKKFLTEIEKEIENVEKTNQHG